MSDTQKYDVIVIGSGIGGLSCASFLAQQQGKRVLMLERHFKVGGFTHTFRRGKYEWDVGIHYIGNMNKGRSERAVFDYITQGQVKWHKMPESYDCMMFPDFTFSMVAGKNQFMRALIETFPDEQSAIEQYFADLKAAGKWFESHMTSKVVPKPLSGVASLMSRNEHNWGKMTTKEYLDKNFQDPRLKALLPAQWGDHGIPPSQSSFVVHALIANHYLYGGWYPIGTSKTIADSIVPVIEKAGGQVLVNHAVDEIIIENNKAVGVRVTHKKGKQHIQKEFFADHIVSNAGAYITYMNLIPESYPLDFRDEIASFPESCANVTLYLGLKDDPRTLGFQGENYWMFTSLDHDENYDKRNDLINGKVSHCYMSFPSIKNPDATTHTAELIALLDAEPFAQWQENTWKKRGEDYEQTKQKISEALLNFVEERHPGFRELVDYCELSTPLSTEHFTGFKNGQIYGTPAIPERYEAEWIGVRTPIKNLYLTGTDATSHGVVGAMMAGAMSASLIMGLRHNFVKLMSDAMKYSQTLAD